MWIDITIPMDESYPCWPGDLAFKETVTSVIGEYGATCNLSTIAMSSHFGTHLDAPFHFVKNGKTIDEIDLDLLIGRCMVIAVENERLVEACHVKPLIEPGIRRLLIKTDNSKRDFRGEFRKDFVGISVDCAEYLAGVGIKLLGIDYYSIAPFDHTAEAVHRAFLGGNDTVALEGVDLSEVIPGEYELICLPLKSKGASGAPARVVLGGF